MLVVVRQAGGCTRVSCMCSKLEAYFSAFDLYTAGSTAVSSSVLVATAAAVAAPDCCAHARTGAVAQHTLITRVYRTNSSTIITVLV